MWQIHNNLLHCAWMFIDKIQQKFSVLAISYFSWKFWFKLNLGLFFNIEQCYCYSVPRSIKFKGEAIPYRKYTIWNISKCCFVKSHSQTEVIKRFCSVKTSEIVRIIHFRYYFKWQCLLKQSSCLQNIYASRCLLPQFIVKK